MYSLDFTSIDTFIDSNLLRSNRLFNDPMTWLYEPKKIPVVNNSVYDTTQLGFLWQDFLIDLEIDDRVRKRVTLFVSISIRGLDLISVNTLKDPRVSETRKDPLGPTFCNRNARVSTTGRYPLKKIVAEAFLECNTNYRPLVAAEVDADIYITASSQFETLPEGTIEVVSFLVEHKKCAKLSNKELMLRCREFTTPRGEPKS